MQHIGVNSFSCMESLSQNPFWVTSGVFTSNDIRRMLDIEYVSELAVATLFGPQNKKTSLDGYYASFESEFPDKEVVERTFTMVLGELAMIIDWPTSQRWSRKVDFYTLFLVMANRAEQFPLDRQERTRLSELLQEFSNSVTQVLRLNEEDFDYLRTPPAARTYARGVRNSSDLGSRRTRIFGLESFLKQDELAEQPKSHRAPGPLQSLPRAEDLLAVEDDDESDDEIDGLGDA